MGTQSMRIIIPIESKTTKENKTIDTPVLLDTGAGGNFMNKNYTKWNNIILYPLDKPIIPRNVDGSLNQEGEITHYTWVRAKLNRRPSLVPLLVTNLGAQDIIFGLPWFKEHSPQIEWSTGNIKLPRTATANYLMYQQTDKKRNQESKDKTPVTVHQLTTRNTMKKKQEPKTPRRSDSPNWRKEPTSPVRQTTKTTETRPRNELIKIAKTTMIQEVPEEMTTETTEKQETEITDDKTPDYDTTLATLETDNIYPLDKIWINAKTGISQTLAIQESADKKEKTLDEMLPAEVMDYKDVFDKQTAERFLESRPWDHAIDLKEDFVPKDCKIYPLSPPEQIELDKFIDKNLAKGYIWPSKSPMASPFFINKKDGKLRPCQDYQKLNEGTIKNVYPLPLISELIDQLKGAWYFTKLDVQWGYNNIRIKDGDQWKAAFKTKRGLFKPTVMFFGMCNSPATFQAMMDDILKDEKHEGWVIIYMDDIFVFTKELLDNICNTRRVLQVLRDNNLYLKPEKCSFWQTKTEYLGLIIKEGKIGMDPTKLKGIADWPAPTTVKQVRSFLGFGNYYRRFIHGYGDLTKPLNDLLRKEEKFDWNEERQETFDELKRKFQEAPVLQMPDPSKSFVVEMDASKFASGGILQQQDTNSDWHSCSYISKSFSETERNCHIPYFH